MKTAPITTSRFVIALVSGALGAVFFALPVFADTLFAGTPTGSWSGDYSVSCSSGVLGDLVITSTGASHSVYQDGYIGYPGFSTLSTGHFDGSIGSHTETNECTNLHNAAGGNGWFVEIFDSSLLTQFRTYFKSGGSQPSTNFAATYQPLSQPDFTQISFPVVYSSSTMAIATSSSLWQSISIASSTQSCNSGNLFADALCGAGTYLFIPNQTILSAYATLPQTEAGHWPFSWIIAVQSAFSAQSASSTANLPTYSYAFYGSDPASTTALGHILPSFDFLSSTTVLQYVGQSNWNILQAFIGFVLYLAFAYDVFFTLRNRLHRV